MCSRIYITHASKPSSLQMMDGRVENGGGIALERQFGRKEMLSTIHMLLVAYPLFESLLAATVLPASYVTDSPHSHFLLPMFKLQLSLSLSLSISLVSNYN